MNIFKDYNTMFVNIKIIQPKAIQIQGSISYGCSDAVTMPSEQVINNTNILTTTACGCVTLMFLHVLSTFNYSNVWISGH